MSKKWKLKAGVAIAAMVAIPSAAYAQESDEAAASNEILVTAQKRSERLEEVPISITALGGKQLSAANVTNFTEIGALAPGATISQQGPFYLPAIRGVTSQGITSGQENNVATYVDGIYQASKVGLNFDLSSVESIEILKGPQGTLFGRNATGGAILVKTRDPGDALEGNVKLSYGRFDDKRVQAYFSVPLGENVGFNISGLYRDSDGYYKDISGFNSAPHKEVNVRSKLKFTSSGDFSATVGLNYSNLKDPLGIAWQYFDSPGVQLIDPTAVVTSQPYRTSFSFAPKVDTETINPTLTTEFKLGDVDVKTLSSYADIKHTMILDVDGSPLPAVIQLTKHKNTTHTQEINLSSKIGDTVDWVIGAYYYRNKYVLGTNQINGGPNGRDSLVAESVAGFADATIRLGESFFLTGGLRYSWEKSTVEYRHLSVDPKVLGSDSWNSLTPRVVLRYELGDRTNVYASYSKGFKSGTFDSSSAIGAPAANPEKIDAYEIGFKTASSTLRFDAATYYYDYKDLQDSQTIQLSCGTPPCGLGTTVTNVGNAEIYGAEAQITYTPTRDLNLFAGIAWTHARYKSYPDSTAVVPIEAELAPGFFATVWDSIPQDLSGKQMPRAPEWALNAGFNYRLDAGNTGSFDLAGSVAYQSAQNPTVSTTDPRTGGYLARQDGYALVNLSLTWNLPGDRFQLSVYGKNITDAKYRIVDRAYNVFGHHRIWGEPATYGVSVGMNF